MLKVCEKVRDLSVRFSRLEDALIYCCVFRQLSQHSAYDYDDNHTGKCSIDCIISVRVCVCL